MLRPLTRVLPVALVVMALALPCRADDTLGLIPWPVEVRRTEGIFTVDESTVIAAPRESCNEAERLAEPLRRATGFAIPVVVPPLGKPDPGTILLRQGTGPGLEVEGSYRLSVTPTIVTIEARTPAGHFYGTRTLLQLLPPQAATGRRPAAGKTIEWSAPCVEIRDQPRFSWRALMVDESRNFLGMEAMKDYLDEMAALKMNVLHWHLIDGQGWRLQIRRYPKLTSSGAVSPGTCRGGVVPPRDPSVPPGRYYYTQEEAREIIAYAAQRHIRIVPEVEMPGHCNAALQAYPEWGAAGVFDTTNPAVVRALQDILDEVMALFPDVVIHTGGDEVNYKAWATAPSIQATMKRKGLESAEPLQQEFTSTMATYLAAKGRRMLYWADSVEQIPAEKSTILQFWRGSPKLMTEAVSRGYDLVNSWHSYTYLDYHYASLPLHKAYAFDPIPSGIDAKWHKHILGLGCQAWGEFMPTRKRVEYQVFPRLAAYAEVGWTAKERKDYTSFLVRLKAQERRWDSSGMRYARACEKPCEELWESVKTNGKKVGHWTPDQLKKCSRYAIKPENNHDWDVTDILTDKGRCLVTFACTGGSDQLHVRQVEMLENGTPIAADPAGFGGATFSLGMSGRSAYLFDVAVSTLKPGAKYTLRTNYFALKGTDSSGDIFLMNVGDLQPLYTEGPDPAMPPLRWWEGTITTAPSTLEWNVTQRTVCSGEYAATFDYMSGAHALVIDKVELLRNGTVIATDEHRGQTGASDTNNIYRLSLPSYATDADYVLRASVHGSGGGHTFGIVHWTCDSDSRTKNQDGK